MKKGIIILGSSNSNGTSQKIAAYINARTNFPIIDLKTKTIGEFLNIIQDGPPVIS